MKVGTLAARYGMFTGKQEKPFWFSSLGQMVQFGANIFFRTFRNVFVSSFGLKKRVTIIVAFHCIERQLKREQK